MQYNEQDIAQIVSRFLAWPLPSDFAPDGGITAARPNYTPDVEWRPVGTNLLTAAQADAMIRHVLAIPSASVNTHPAATGSMRGLVEEMVRDGWCECEPETRNPAAKCLRCRAVAFLAAAPTPDAAASEAGEVDRLREALAFCEAEARAANEVIRQRRAGVGQGRVRVATALHRIEHNREHVRRAALTAQGGAEG